MQGITLKIMLGLRYNAEIMQELNDTSTLPRGIEWSLRAFASMRVVRLFLRARTVINFLMRAASTLEITNGEQRAS